MRNNDASDRDGGLFTVRCMPVPECVTCPGCGLDIDLWTLTPTTGCFFCGRKIFRRESTIH